MTPLSMLAMIPLLLTISMASCKTTESELKSDPLPLRNLGSLPSPASGNAWGGSDSSKWKPEAIYANAISDFTNRLWKLQSVNDVLVSVPVTFIDNAEFNPYGDRQTNARITFNSAWPHKTIPFRAGLVRTRDGSSVIVFEFSPDLNLQQEKIEIAYKNESGELKTLTLNLSRNADGWLTASWTSMPQDMYWGKTVDTGAPDNGSASEYSFFVRPSPNFEDWFPVTFKHPWTTIPKLTATVPAELKSFRENSNVPQPNNLSDPMNFAQTSAQDPIPFDLVYDLGMRKSWPRAFFPSDKPYFAACNVHGNFKKQDHSENPTANDYDPTAVGRNWTWVADPQSKYPDGVHLYPGAETVPFKILYTCFEERRLHHPIGNDPDCFGLARNSEEEAGVPSGGGWHKIGDPAETLFNSLERVPLLVSAGFERPSERSGTFPPNADPEPNGNKHYAFGLKDVAVSRWLWPGEAFLTANNDKDSNGKDAKNFHWFLFHADREVCTVEWVHPNRPDDSMSARF